MRQDKRDGLGVFGLNQRDDFARVSRLQEVEGLTLHALHQLLHDFGGFFFAEGLFQDLLGIIHTARTQPHRGHRHGVLVEFVDDVGADFARHIAHSHDFCRQQLDFLVAHFLHDARRAVFPNLNQQQR